MHLLATTSGVIDGASEAIDLKQTPADVAIITAADSELALLATAHDRVGGSLRLANLMQLQHNFSVDLYIDKTLSRAKLIIVRLLGGKSYWPYGIDALRQLNGVKLAFLPGGKDRDEELKSISTIDAADWEALRGYFVEGGAENAERVLGYAKALIRSSERPSPARPFDTSGTYYSSSNSPFPFSEGEGARRADGVVVQRDVKQQASLHHYPLSPSDSSPFKEGGATSTTDVGIIFYRSVIEGGQNAPIDALINALEARNLSVHAIFVASLKDATSATFIREHLKSPSVILNCTSFAVGDEAADPLAPCDCPVLQVTLAGTSEDHWQQSTAGLAAKDLAMSVVLPELDGRIHAGVASFKADQLWHEATQCRLVTYKPFADRIAHIANLAQNWAALRTKPNAEKKIAILLANYPNKDGRIANGVGYDTPASTIAIMQALQRDGYAVSNTPSDGNALIESLQTQRTNAASDKTSEITLNLNKYEPLFKSLDPQIQKEVEARWGAPSTDPFVQNNAFHLPVLAFGNILIGIQPARGYNIDPKATYHDPALPPPHGYIATYLWLKHIAKIDAIIHNGKHGNLEWLPGKATGLSSACYPDALIAEIPQAYPFIVNDPGEGTQAKRRTSAVIIDHLTPPLTRAETYGPLKDLEALVDEYYLASGLDQRRITNLKDQILDLTRRTKLDADAGFTGDEEQNLQKLDAYLCDLKEAQIRDGLHVLGTSPTGQQETDLLVALTRVPRGLGEGKDQSLIRAIANDLELDFDPLDCDFAREWKGKRPEVLAELSSDPWRTHGDTVERIELFASSLLKHPLPPSGYSPTLRVREKNAQELSPSREAWGSTAQPGGTTFARRMSPGVSTHSVLSFITTTLRPTLASCGTHELANLLNSLAARRVPPAPSGAPTRGRLDVLPTGRNFYSIDNRALPTPTAWNLGQRSAADLLTRHYQDTGTHLRTAALSAWGTSNMRTGGDDIAQALALIGVEPKWDTSSWRVTGYTIIPLAKLGRPRVDVTLRISGFFRDAFPQQIELLDKAMRAVAALDEDAHDNPTAARAHAEAQTLIASGATQEDASTLAATRIFGSKPGSYGAGLQALIDEKIWDTRADLAAAYMAWGSFAYGARQQGEEQQALFKQRLTSIEAVIHNQDNREHDILDSDDYYQFEGGLSAAVETVRGTKPRAYHADHSRPERPVIRTLDEEVARVVRSRVVNPKWINGVKRHGYKGAFEIAATVDYMFAFAATADAVKSHHFDLAYDAYLIDDDTRDFIANNNPAALKEIAARFEEAITRGLWRPRLNSAYARLKELQS